MAETTYKNKYEEEKALKKAEKEKAAKKAAKEEAKKNKKYKSMHERPWGKAIIFILGILMCMSGLVSVIYLIIHNILH